MLARDILTFATCLSLREHCARAEWVEISQNGYRRGFKPHTTPNNFLSRPLPNLHPAVAVTKVKPKLNSLTDHSHDVVNTQYANVTVPTLTRKKTVQRIHIGSIEKVDLESEVKLVQKAKEQPSHVKKDLVNDTFVITKPSQAITNVSQDKNSNVSQNDQINPIMDKPNQNVADNLTSKTNTENSTTQNVTKIEETTIDEKEDGAGTLDNPKNGHFKTLAGIIKVLKLVQDTISKSSHRTVKSKMRYLEELRDSIMFNIEERIEALWPTDADAAAGGRDEGRSRASRSSKGDQVDFPSAESALMTISFLTFAVFLIKLVMQVIQTYKAKTMMMTPVFTAMGRAVFARTHK